MSPSASRCSRSKTIRIQLNSATFPLSFAQGRNPWRLRPCRRGTFGVRAVAVRRHQATRGRVTLEDREIVSAAPAMRWRMASSMCRKNADFTACCNCRSSRMYRRRHSPAGTSRNGFLRMAEELALARNMPSVSTRAPPPFSVPVGTLSGGNQQKVVIGKWFATN